MESRDLPAARTSLYHGLHIATAIQQLRFSFLKFMTRQTCPRDKHLFLTGVIGNQLAYNMVDTFA